MAEESKQGKSSEGKAGEKGSAMAKPVSGRVVAPFDDIERMMDRMFAEFLPRNLLQPLGWRGTRMAEWEPQVPRVDVLEREDQLVVRAELPGVQKKDLDVAIRDNLVTIKASTQHEEEDEQGDYYRRELHRGSFSRTISLPTEVDGSKAKASFKDGILELSLPKAEHARSHRVNIE